MEAFTVTCRTVAQFFLQQKLKYNERLEVFMALNLHGVKTKNIITEV
jgi:hypothetical protein